MAPSLTDSFITTVVCPTAVSTAVFPTVAALFSHMCFLTNEVLGLHGGVSPPWQNSSLIRVLNERGHSFLIRVFTNEVQDFR